MPETSSSPSPTISPMSSLISLSSKPPNSNSNSYLQFSSSPPSSFSSLLNHDDDDDFTLLPSTTPTPTPNPNFSNFTTHNNYLPYIDPSSHISSQFYTFTVDSHALMLSCLLAGRAPSTAEIRQATSPAVLASWRSVWKDRNEDTAYATAWKRIQDKLAASSSMQGNNNGDNKSNSINISVNQGCLFFKSNLVQKVSHVGMWRDIVAAAHADTAFARHLGLKDTVDKIKQSWTVGAKLYGIPESFIRACVMACPVCAALPPGFADSSSSAISLGRGKRRRRFEYTETIDVPARDVPKRLQQLAAKHKVVLCIRQKYIRYKPFMAEVKDYACHRAGVPSTSVSAALAASDSSGGATSEGKKARVVKREPYQSKRCGCGFRIRAIVPIANYNEKDKTFVYQEEGTAVFKLYAVHSGHEPGPLDGNARIVHRLVGHKGALEIDPEIYGVSEENEPCLMGTSDVDVDVDEPHHMILQQVRELRTEVGLLKGKVVNMPSEMLGSLSTELADILLRIRKFSLDRSVYHPEGPLMMINDEVGPWGTAEVQQHLDRHDTVFCKDDEMIEEDDADFGSGLGSIVPWDGIDEECEDRKMLMGESPKCDKWMIKDAGGDFDEKSILNCGVDEDDDGDRKLIKQLAHDESMVPDPNLVGMHVDGFYHGTKWYDSPVGLDSGGDVGDVCFRHGEIV